MQSHILSLFIKLISTKYKVRHRQTSRVSSFLLELCVLSEEQLPSHILKLKNKEWLIVSCTLSSFDVDIYYVAAVSIKKSFISTLCCAAMVPFNLSGLNLLLLCFHSTHCPAMCYLLQKKGKKKLGLAKLSKNRNGKTLLDHAN